MDRVTSYPNPLAAIVGLLPDLTLAQLHAVKVEAAAAEALLRSRLSACAGRDREQHRERLLRHYAKGGEPLKVVPADDEPRDWAAPYEDEAVRQGQDGPDPAYVVAPRFGGVECRSVPADPFVGFPDLPPGPAGRPPEALDALAPLYEVQRQTAALAERDRCPLTGDAADDDGDTPLVVPPFTDEQEGDRCVARSRPRSRPAAWPASRASATGRSRCCTRAPAAGST